MPKQTFKIEGFHGGLNTNADPRDISEIQSSDIVGISINNLGRLRNIGRVFQDSSSSNTISLLNNKGLFVMDSDRKVSNNALSNESLIIVYDDGGNSFDVKDSGGWSTAEISLDTNDPVFYSSDGILRIGDGSFGQSGKWYGYIPNRYFNSLRADSSAIDNWISLNQDIDSPTLGKCLISNPEVGSDSNGVNSSASEYIGNVIDVSGDDVAVPNAVNLRVGVQYSANYPSAASNYTTSNSTDSDSSTIYPLLNDQTVTIAEQTSGTYDYVSVARSVDNNVSEDQSMITGFYITTAEWNDLDKVEIQLTDGSEFMYNVFPKSDIKPDCWNLLVSSITNLDRGEASGEGISAWDLRVYDNITNGSVGFSVAGPVVATNPGLEGFQEGLYSFHYSFLYDDEKQESLPFAFIDVDSVNFSKVNVLGGSVLFNFDTYINTFADPSGSYSFNKRIVGSRLYYKLEENDSFYLIGELDFIDKGFKWFPEGNDLAYSMVNTSNASGNFLSKSCIIKGISPDSANIIDTFKNINGFDTQVKSLVCRYKTAVVHGRRCYVGNIKKDDVVHSDRMIKSRVNKFDTFPSDMGVVDVAIRDGESIVKLEAFADRILQFKQKSLYIINVAENIDFLEDVYRNKGCEFSYHVVKTDYGITWFNKFGVYLFDGKSVKNLLEKDNIKLIDESDWETFITDGGDDTDMSSAHIGYVPNRRQILVKNENTELLIYDLLLRSWTKTGINHINVNNGSMTNFALDSDQNLFYISGNSSQIQTFDPSPTYVYDYKYTTKDIDFGQPSVRKKIHKVYITYKSGGTTNVLVKYDTNGHTDYNLLFANGTNFTSNELVYDSGNANKWITAELKPNTSSEANNINSFALQLTSDGTVPATFEINDITIVYRIKNVK